MKNVKLKLAVLGAFSILSAQVMATGLVTLPNSGSTAYVSCNATGNFGSGTSVAPTTGANNTCAVFPGAINNTPVTGFTLVSNPADVTITANSQTLATLNQRVFRNSGNTECVYGKRLRMATSGTFDYNPSLAGSQRLEVNDIALGGFSATATLQAGYYYTGVTDEVVFRIGHAFTAVQMQSNAAGTAPATGYLALPNTASPPASSTEINGVGQTLSPPGSPTAAQQSAEIRTNWVDFTTDITGGLDEDGTTYPDSAMLYVRAGCTSTAPVTTANTIRIRQTGQETQPFVTILASGQTRSGANANF